MNLSPDMAIYSGGNKSTLGGFSSNAHRHQQRPVSEILKPTENFASPESKHIYHFLSETIYTDLNFTLYSTSIG